MYLELVKWLRARAKREDEYYQHGGDIINEAADAIEELSKQVELDQMVRAANRKKPCWIPVTERLPDIAHTVIVFGRMKYEWETVYIRFVDAAEYTVDGVFETFNDWYEGQDEFEITHWMPLPAAPEGKTDADI